MTRDVQLPFALDFSVRRPRVLDLFCGAGGASVGYWRAGFDVVGVDHVPQPDYPFPFHLADALDFDVAGFDVVHASPPCQAFTQMSARWRGRSEVTDAHEDLLAPTIARLDAAARDCPRLVTCVENVPGAVFALAPTLKLHGGMFGLRVYRPRLFRLNRLVLAPQAARTVDPVGVYGRIDGRWTYRRRNNGHGGKQSVIRAWKSLAEGQDAMDCRWIRDAHQLAQAIPPAYTEHIGAQLMAYVR